ncbi:uncharacterized protein CLUP02_04820 [Colletotrichum lupini]|uniref:Uncharacterized protein n=1 Tax=Colletotrichum lupini TaxID=145971 RepID=A0A9Q8WDN1_9PEZI|nr:uncharacterized protein CLUP02_04820 [Colletotrichum lupini]UQC79341.1 hypothetical protein CLUP02_04820 [Colletotrichum lupini]
MDEEQSPLMRIPAEIRIMIYEYLLDDAGERRLAVRNKAMHQLHNGALSTYRRTSYRIIERSFHRQCFLTTYAHHHPASPKSICTPKSWPSTAASTVRRVTFFTAARTASISELTIRKDGPVMHCNSESDRLDWATMCAYLGRLDKAIPRLRIIVEGGRPTAAWEGPQVLSVSDLRLLALIKHDSMEWVAELAKVEGIEQLEIVPRIRHLPAPGTTATLLFAAFSASIDTALVEYLQTDCGLPATAVSLTA